MDNILVLQEWNYLSVRIPCDLYHSHLSISTGMILYSGFSARNMSFASVGDGIYHSVQSSSGAPLNMLSVGHYTIMSS